MLATMHTCGGQRIAFGSGFCFHPEVPGEQTQVIRFVSKAVYSLSMCLFSPRTNFYSHILSLILQKQCKYIIIIIVVVVFLFFIIFPETDLHIAEAGLELLPLPCLCLPRARITGICFHTHRILLFIKLRFITLW